MNEQTFTSKSEARLEELRAIAWSKGRVDAPGIRAAGAPLPIASPSTGYYGVPLLKPPVWTWEVPLYFFVGGAAGGAAVIAEAARLTGAGDLLVKDARRLAATGSVLSAPLLIADLGRHERFLNMLRVFKPQSPMSVGAWTLAAFSTFAGAAATADIARQVAPRFPLTRPVGNGAGLLAAASGLVMMTYTGVLLGATVIPVWNRSVRTLPIHFAASGLASAISILELSGHFEDGLHYAAIGTAAFETATGARIELSREPELDPLRKGASGTLTRIAGVLSGPVPLALRLLGGNTRRTRRLAALSTIVGSLATRLAWVEAGKASAKQTTTAA